MAKEKPDWDGYKKSPCSFDFSICNSFCPDINRWGELFTPLPLKNAKRPQWIITSASKHFAFPSCKPGRRSLTFFGVGSHSLRLKFIAKESNCQVYFTILQISDKMFSISPEIESRRFLTMFKATRIFSSLKTSNGTTKEATQQWMVNICEKMFRFEFPISTQGFFQLFHTRQLKHEQL